MNSTVPRPTYNQRKEDEKLKAREEENSCRMGVSDFIAFLLFSFVPLLSRKVLTHLCAFTIVIIGKLDKVEYFTHARFSCPDFLFATPEK